MGNPGDEAYVWVREIDATEDAVEWHAFGAGDGVDYAAEWTVPFDAETFASEVVVGAFGSGARAAIETDDRLYEGRTYGALADRLDDRDLDVNQFEVSDGEIGVRYHSSSDRDGGKLTVRGVTGNVDRIEALYERTTGRELTADNRDHLDLYAEKPGDVDLVDWATRRLDDRDGTDRLGPDGDGQSGPEL